MITPPTCINIRIYFCYQCNVYRYSLFLSKISLNKPYLQIIRIIFNDLRRSVWEFPVRKLYSVTRALKLYITDSVIASKHCAKFRETDELCISLIYYFTDCKQSFTKII